MIYITWKNRWIDDLHFHRKISQVILSFLSKMHIWPGSTWLLPKLHKTSPSCPMMYWNAPSSSPCLGENWQVDYVDTLHLGFFDGNWPWMAMESKCFNFCGLKHFETCWTFITLSVKTHHHRVKPSERKLNHAGNTMGSRDYITSWFNMIRTMMNHEQHHEPWLVGGIPTPLKNDGVRQWEGLYIPYMKWNIIQSGLKPPTSHPLTIH